MIDVYAAAGTFSDKHRLAQDLARAVMRWEAVPEIPLFADNTAAFIHDLPAEAISTAAGRSDYVRVQVLTPVGVLDRDKQLGVVKELTEIVAQAAGDPTLAQRTWVLTHRVAGGWLGHRGTRQHAGRHRRGGPRGPLRERLDHGGVQLIGALTTDGRGRVLADGTVMPLLGLGVWQVPDGPRVRARCAGGARARVPPHRHRAGVRKRGAASAGRCARAASRATRCSSRRSSIPAGATHCREAAYSIERLGVDYVDLYLVHWPAGGADLGLGRDGGTPARAATPGRSASPTSTPSSSTS